ncbi:hypothetical protein ACR79T_15635 [Sphingobacterium spiritivorum]|uniref:hypothetical protein n=1 Tax=Sphingobacterium spiritivorum TaxID=258 RepID=UPI003DA408FF
MKSEMSNKILLKGILIVFLLREVIDFSFQASKILTLLFSENLDIWKVVFFGVISFVIIGEIIFVKFLPKIKISLIFISLLILLSLNKITDFVEPLFLEYVGIDYIKIRPYEKMLEFYPSRIFQIHYYLILIYVSYVIYHNRKLKR